MDAEILKELKEIKKLLQVIASNQEQNQSFGTVTIDVTGIDEFKKLLENVKN